MYLIKGPLLLGMRCPGKSHSKQLVYSFFCRVFRRLRMCGLNFYIKIRRMVIFEQLHDFEGSQNDQNGCYSWICFRFYVSIHLTNQPDVGILYLYGMV